MDNLGNTGYVYANAFHSQAYYPLPGNFSNVNADQYTLSGTRIKDFVDRSNPSFITAAGRPWGYVDNNLKQPFNGLPDNPYTDNVEEGSGGDAFDIHWAVDAEGNYVDLDQVHFIKVHNATLADAGWLGEVSTEITGAFDVAPVAPISDWDSTSLVLNDIPLQLNMGAKVRLEAAFFVKGRKANVDNLEWTVSPAAKVSIDENNIMTAIDTGRVDITAVCNYYGNTVSTSMNTTIIAPASIEILFDRSEIQAGQKYPVDAVVKDQSGGKIPGLQFIWETSNDKLSVIQEDGNYFLAPVEEGESRLYVYPVGYPDIRDSLDVTILEAAETMPVYLTIKTHEKTFIPKTLIEVSNFELSPFITNPNNDYGLSEIRNVAAAHAIASVFENVAFESDLRFKDTDESGLYVYKLPVVSGTQTRYYYGYGNNNPGQSSCWMVKIGDNTWFDKLEDIRLFENDEILAYYVEDITSDWDLYKLTCSETAANKGESVEFTLQKESFNLYSETTVLSTGTEPAEGETVFLNGEVLIENQDTVKTNNEGKVTLSFNEPGTFEVQIASELRVLTVGNLNTITVQKTKQALAFPNPASEKISLQSSGMSGEVRIMVFSSGGKLIFNRNLNKYTGDYELDVSNWNEGVYFLQMVSSGTVAGTKIIVKH
jgi:hypothetical protein